MPFADVGPFKVPDSLTDEQVLFLSDIFPDRLHGGRELQHPAGRHGRRLGLRAGRAVRDPQRVPARRRPRHRHRHACPSGCRWPAHGGAETIDSMDRTCSTSCRT